ncbi:hypothetical protein FF1_012665 [Malus domestica]
MAWWFCLLRPDHVKPLVNMSVAFSPRNLKRKPIDTFRALFGDDYNICRFQLPKPTTQLEKKNTQASEHAAASPSCK